MFNRLLGRRPAPAVPMPQLTSAPPGLPIAGHIGNRRTLCWWEPIFATGVAPILTPYDWNLAANAGPTNCYIAGAALDAHVTPGDTFKIRGKTFQDCDFQGAFRASPVIMFDECRFEGCDFAYSSWLGAHFRKCTFINSSLSLAAFEKCEFRDCAWQGIGMASKTDFTKTFISNPKALIAAMVSLTNPKDTTLKHKNIQWYRRSGTRAHVLRSLMLSHGTVGDEHVFYETVKLHELQRYKARMAEDLHNILFEPVGKKVTNLFGLVLHLLNYLLMALFGLTNRWGESVSRPCLVFGAIYGAFGGIYTLGKFAAPIPHPWQKSFDITLLVGYGNQVKDTDAVLSMTQNIHAVLAVIVYTVFFSTMISKLSRAR